MTAEEYIIENSCSHDWSEDTISILHAKKALKMAKKEAEKEFLKKAVEGKIVDDGGEIQLVVPALPIITRYMDEGDKVKVIIIKED